MGSAHVAMLSRPLRALFSVALFIRQMLLCDMAYIVSVTVMDVASPCPSIVQALQTAIDAAHVRSSEEGGR